MQDHITEVHVFTELVQILCAYVKYTCKVRSAEDGHITLAELAFVIQQVKRFLNGERAGDHADLQQAHMDLRMAHTVIMEQLKSLIGEGAVAEEICENVVLREMDDADEERAEVGSKKLVGELKRHEV